MTQPQSDTLTPYAPLPVRARGTLEIFDTAFKLFRRYAGILMAWSALSSLINLIPFIGQMLYVFTMPLIFGAVSCVVAGAVRGQKVGFKQVWGFTKPRYGALLGVLILAGIFLTLVMFGLMLAFAFLTILFANLATSFGIFATIVAWIIGIIGGLIASSFLLAVAMGWVNLAPVIACLEDNNRGSNALSRAWQLMSGHWRKACGVATITALAGTAAWLVIMGFSIFFFSGGWDKLLGADVSFLSGLAITGMTTLFTFAWMPLQTVIGAVFYLDLRTRKEALDLEWTNYAAKPEALPGQQQNVPDPAFSPAPQSPTSYPPYAPPSSTQAPSPETSQPQAPLFAPSAPAPAPPQPSSFQPAVTPSVDTPPDSFADFASQIETAPSPLDLPAPAAPTTETVAPIGAPVVSLPAQPESPVGAREIAPTFTSANSPTAPPAVESPSPEEQAPPSSFPTPAMPQPVPPTVSAPVVEPEAQPAETSSFAPRRFRRAASEDEDYPSSFGGGAR